MSTFRRSLPLITTSFINKTGTIGLSLVPMILVERHLSAGQSSLVMTLIKASTLGGTLLGGLSSDRLARPPNRKPNHTRGRVRSPSAISIAIWQCASICAASIFPH